MRGWVNDAVRYVIARAIRMLGVVLNGCQKIRINFFNSGQNRLKRKYRLKTDTVQPGTDVRFAMTSGSTGEAKKILYSKRRLLWFKIAFSDMFVRACRAHRLRRTSLYVFSSFQRDASLTSLLLEEEKLPSYFSTLQAPYRVQQHQAIRALASEYGAPAVRLWILTLSNPAVLYATNPSTISTFFDQIENNWTKCSQLIRTWLVDPNRFDPVVHKIARRLESRRSTHRLHLIAASTAPLPLDQFAPAVRAYICWTGGYVKPFLDRLSLHLPPSRYRLIAMYSMSTETIETKTLFRNNDEYFLPLARGVVYEFMEPNGNLLPPAQLIPGKTYAMVVSDSYGLRRYQTDDVFECRRMLNGVPDLVFLRRRSLEYSFTGEKVTAEQLTTVFDQLRSQHPLDGFLTCVPSLLPAPHYKLILISNNRVAGDLGTQCDQLLSSVNCEYKIKRANGTLGPISFAQVTAAEFAACFHASWETQFKFLPLYQNAWELERLELAPVS